MTTFGKQFFFKGQYDFHFSIANSSYYEGD